MEPPTRLVIVAPDEGLTQWIALGTLFIEGTFSLALASGRLVQDPVITGDCDADPTTGPQPGPRCTRAGVGGVDL